VRKSEHIRLGIVPNQALYQAEPQPELIANISHASRGALPYFAYFAASGKDAYVNGKVF
jgi:hypothetical protein